MAGAVELLWVFQFMGTPPRRGGVPVPGDGATGEGSAELLAYFVGLGDDAQ